MTFNLSTQFDLAVDEVKKLIEHSEQFCLYLEGDLGAGKTYFVKHLIAKIYPEVEVYSPTYTLVNLYNDIYHLDLYRIEEEQELEELGVEDMDKLIVEWPKNWNVAQTKPIRLIFTVSKDERTLSIQ